MNFKAQCLQAFAYAILSLAGALMLIFFAWLYWPYKTIAVTSPAKILNTVDGQVNHVKAGEQLKYLKKYCSYVNDQATVSRKLANEFTYTYATVENSFQMGCYEEVISVEIPNNLSDGIYHLEITAKFKVNPVRYITTIWETETFHVVNK